MFFYKQKFFKIALLCGGLFFLLACDNGTNNYSGENIVLIQSESVIADADLLAEVAKEFYKTHPDQYDMLVLWSSPEFAPGHSFYLPVKNDVQGIGYEHVGDELFDNSADYGSANLQGIIWMGPDWITNTDKAAGPRSVLGILAQETGHRWAATMQFKDPVLVTDSSALLEDSYHWNFYLNTGGSPMGGNRWESLGDSLYRALPADNVKFCELDLYVMGLLSAEEVDPLELLVNVRIQSASDAINSKSSVSSTTSDPVTVSADVVEITIDQIIEAEGERDPNAGFNAKTIRQAWIYVYKTQNFQSHSDLVGIEDLQKQWNDYFSQATSGLSTMDTVLY